MKNRKRLGTMPSLTLLPTLLIHMLSPMQRLSCIMQACILSPYCFIKQAKSSSSYPASFEKAMWSLHPSDYEGPEPQLGLKGC